MFHPSSQHISFRQQIITLSQNYPCPRCAGGVVEPYGLTETFKCNCCKRMFVPLKGGRYLFPANDLGWKVAPTFWWDGYRWHWAGTTATASQLTTIVVLALLPVLILNLLHSAHILADVMPQLPEWCNPLLISPIVALLSLQIIYICCWDFDFLNHRHS